ncbi:MAG: amidohydrolase family protein [Kiritimatiellaeota bacterium]|nr:amidohydrolase family protein [Kiritimatiellota bacterium]
MKIDAHHHFWRYNPAEYDWIDDAMAVIRRDFLPGDLELEIAAADIDGVVSVQARQCIEETEWLLGLAATSPFVKGVVGWVPLVDPGVGKLLERFAERPVLKAVRHVVQGEPEGFMLHADFNRGIDLLSETGLAYDILIHERQLPEAIELVDRHPGQCFVLDHIAKPCIRNNVFEPWATRMRELAGRDRIYCKISGLVTEADYRNWTEEQLQPYLETVLEAFGPARLMFGSDWPVCLVACPYRRWHQIVTRFIAGLSETEQARILGGTAVEAYRLAAGDACLAGQRAPQMSGS